MLIRALLVAGALAGPSLSVSMVGTDIYFPPGQKVEITVYFDVTNHGKPTAPVCRYYDGTRQIGQAQTFPVIARGRTVFETSRSIRILPRDWKWSTVVARCS